MATPAAGAYRQLLKQCALTEMMVELPVPGGLLQSVRTRYRHVLSRNLQLPVQQRRFIVKKQQVSFARIMEALQHCHENETLYSLSRALSTNFGNDAYRATLFRHFAETLEFDTERERRDEVGEKAVSERQNKLMQAAVFPYLERLCILYSPTLQNDNDAMLRALSSRKAGVVVEFFPNEPHNIVVEIDEALNKQTIYLSAPAESSEEFLSQLQQQQQQNSSSSSNKSKSKSKQHDTMSNYHDPYHRVDSAELETQRGTILHLEWMNVARRCFDTLVDESAIHRSRGTVVIGHGIGGAIATALALMMQAEGFMIRNVVTFGAPKVIEEILERNAAPLNSVRVVLAGDPIVHLPVSGTEGRLFRHTGELLVVSSPSVKNLFGDNNNNYDANNDTKNVADTKEEEEEDIDVEKLHEQLFADSVSDVSSSSDDSLQMEEKEKVQQQKEQEEKEHEEENKASSSENVLEKPFSVLAYRIALADEDSSLEYYEQDEGIWEKDDIRAIATEDDEGDLIDNIDDDDDDDDDEEKEHQRKV